MKKRYILFLLCLMMGGGPLFAQDDLLNLLNDSTAKKPGPVYATFKSTRLVNLHTNEQMKAKHLDFRINHRFGFINGGTKDFSDAAYNFFGLDGPTSVRLSFEYGVTDKLMVGVGRSSVNKIYDGFAKYKLWQQQRNGMPVSISYFVNAGISTIQFTDQNIDNKFTSRLSYTHQLIITRKFNDHFSLLVNPTLVHRNLVNTKAEPNDIFAVGIGGSIKITRSTRLTLEYIPRLNGRDAVKDADGDPVYQDAVAIGFDIETGGHVFQVHFTNATGMIEQTFIPESTGKLTNWDLRLGFNISRTFSFDHSGKKKW